MKGHKDNGGKSLVICNLVICDEYGLKKLCTPIALALEQCGHLASITINC